MSAWRRLTTAVRPVRKPMAVSIVARIVQLVAGIALAAAGGWSVAALATGPVKRLGPIFGVLAVLAIIKAVAGYVEQYQGHHVAFGLLAEMRSDFLRQVEPLAPAALTDARSGDLVERVMSDVDRVEVFYAHTLAPVVAGMVVPTVTVAAVSIWVDPRMGLALAVAMLLVGFVVPSVSSRAARGAAERAGTLTGDLAAHVTDGIQGLGEVVVYDYGPRRLGEMERIGDDIWAEEGSVARIDGLRGGLNLLLTGGTLVIVAALGGAEVAVGRMDPATLAATLATALVAFGPLQDLQQLKPSFDRAMAAAARIFAITDLSPVVTDPPASAPEEPEPVLRFRRVAFTYPGRPVAAVEDVDVEVGPGVRVAVVGPSGAGKSTLPRLAVRFWDPDRGSVTLGDRNVSSLPLDQLRRTVAVVTQESHLFRGTVADNLRLGRPDASHQQMRQAAWTAAIAEEIEALPDAYQTAVGEMGVLLSGGQRQRIALARGLLTAAPLLVLDEATSELDVDTEAEILARLPAALEGRGLLLIAHRLATVVDADEVIVMDEGRVVERGSHRELLAAGGLYARLWARQRDEL